MDHTQEDRTPPPPIAMVMECVDNNWVVLIKISIVLIIGEPQLLIWILFCFNLEMNNVDMGIGNFISSIFLLRNIIIVLYLERR